MGKICTLAFLSSSLPNPRPRPLILATGFFDLLHQEHRRFLRQAKAHGHLLVVGLESDYRARKLKGPDRPFLTQLTRAHQLAHLPFVNLVVLLPANFGHLSLRRLLLASLRPDFLAVSSHSPHQSQKRRLIQQYGGQLLVVHSHNPAISTTILAQKLYNSTTNQVLSTNN